MLSQPRRTRRRPAQPRGASDMSTPVLMTEAGYDRLQLELEAMRDEARHEILERVRHARADRGDLADNGELKDALEEQGLLDQRIAELEALLADAEIATA